MKFLTKIFYILIATSALWADDNPSSSESALNATSQLTKKADAEAILNAIPQNIPAITDTESSEEGLEEKTSEENVVNTEENAEEETPLEDIRELRPAVDLPIAPWKLILLTCTILVGLLALLYTFKKHRKHPQGVSIIPPDPYHKALQELEAALQRIQHIDQRPFATGITDAVRGYLADVFHLPAPEYTTEEVLEQLPNVVLLTEEIRKSIIQLLQQCDLAKFTQLQFDQPDRLKLYHQAKDFIQAADKLIQLQNARTPEQ